MWLSLTINTLFCQECIYSISFSNKGSRYLCSGGSGHIVRIWDLQRKRCIKWLSGHTDTITGVMYNCKDEHLASVSMKGDLILHNLASGARAAELSDPNGQVIVYFFVFFCKMPMPSAHHNRHQEYQNFVFEPSEFLVFSVLFMQGQVLRVLDYSRNSRHILATAGDDGSVHLWDATAKSPKVHQNPYGANCSILILQLFQCYIVQHQHK